MAGRSDLRHAGTLTLLGRLVSNLSTLFDCQIELAKVEARETAIETVRGASTMIVGVVLLLLALVALLMAGILALAMIMPGWLAGLIVFAALAIAGAIVMMVGKGELQAVREQPLSRTRESFREDIQWVKHQLKLSER